MTTADLRDVLGKRILEAAHLAVAMHLGQSVELARRQVVIGGADRDRSTDGPHAAGAPGAAPEGAGGIRSRWIAADGVGE